MQLKDLYHRESNDDLWLISYADMVTLLFLFFVVLYSISAVDSNKMKVLTDELSSKFSSQDSKQTKAKEPDVDFRLNRAFMFLAQVLDFGKDPLAAIASAEKLMMQKNVADFAEQKALEKIRSNLGPKLSWFEHHVAKNEPQSELILSEASLFASGSSELTPDGLSVLNGVIQEVMGVSQITQFEIVGHTDSAMPGARSPFKDNWALSAARAGAVAELFAKNGVNRNRIRAWGAANSRPLISERTNTGTMDSRAMARNRRVEITFMRHYEP